MIIGLAVEPRREEASPARWAGVLMLALAIHLAPMLLLTLSSVPLIEDDTVVTVDFSDESLALAAPENSSNPAPAPATNSSAPTATRQPSPPARSVPPSIAEAPKPPAVAQPAAPKPPQPAPEKKAEEAPKLKELDLDPFTKPSVAFDESKTTKEVPKEAYLSDRNSTAADKGPKDLPRGDPFMDKGESNIIRYKERRGEGNVPALNAADSSGSVKKEGNPDAGKGLERDTRPADLAQPRKPALPENIAVVPEAKPQLDRPNGTKNVRIPLNQPEVVTQQPKSAETKTTEAGPLDTKRPGELSGALPTSPTPADKITADERAAANEIKPKPQPDEQPAISSTRTREQRELDDFLARIDAKGKTDGRGGDAGNKAGVNARVGTKGHEGDGTMRPGHDEAVSDVTTINLESSAAEFDDARFAKKFDAKTAYVKPLARRIDGKWKAERIARTRFRPITGIVTMKIVIRKDGKLLEATEVTRTKGIPDEYVASAKLAIERAADPLSEPFSPALADREKIEFEFNFIY